MRRISFKITVDVTDEFYEKEIKAMQKEIDCGSLQKELKEGSEKGIYKISASYNIKK